jgi:hypothetical protein
MVRQKEGAMGRKRSTRQSLRRIMTTTTALLLLALVASGCTSFDGGGYLRSANLLATTEKATFGINGTCKTGQFNVAGFPEPVQGAGLFNGQFEYHDDAKKIGGVAVRIHGRVAADAEQPLAVFRGLNCREVRQLFAGEGDRPGVAYFQGKYRPQYSTLATQKGTFTGYISDLGEPGVQAGDTFSITLQGGAFNGYTNTGPLKGGNLQVK